MGPAASRTCQGTTDIGTVSGRAAPTERELVRLCAYCLTAAEFALAGRTEWWRALLDIADEVDAALLGQGVDLRDIARAEAQGPPHYRN